MSEEEGRKIASDFGAQYWETSALENVNISEVFKEAFSLASKFVESKDSAGSEQAPSRCVCM